MLFRSPSVANEIAHLSTEDQQAIHSEHQSDFPTMKAEDVDAWKKERTIQKATEAAEKENKHILTADLFLSTQKSMESQASLLESGLEVTETEYQRLLKLQKSLQQTVLKMNNLILKADCRRRTDMP